MSSQYLEIARQELDRLNEEIEPFKQALNRLIETRDAWATIIRNTRPEPFRYQPAEQADPYAARPAASQPMHSQSMQPQPYPNQSFPAQPNPAQPNPAQPSPAQPTYAQPGYPQPQPPQTNYSQPQPNYPPEEKIDISVAPPLANRGEERGEDYGWKINDVREMFRSTYPRS